MQILIPRNPRTKRHFRPRRMTKLLGGGLLMANSSPKATVSFTSEGIIQVNGIRVVCSPFPRSGTRQKPGPKRVEYL